MLNAKLFVPLQPFLAKQLSNGETEFPENASL